MSKPTSSEQSKTWLGDTFKPVLLPQLEQRLKLVPASSDLVAAAAAAAAKSLSCVWLCATPETAAHQAPPSLGFSRQEHWSGLPFPSPMHESEKWKGSRSVVSDS